MRRWKAKLPGGQVLEFESDEPGRVLLEQGHTAFALEEVKRPQLPKIKLEGHLTLSVSEMSEELGVSTKTGYALTHTPGFPVIRIGHRVRVSREGLAEWVKANEGNRLEVTL